MSQKLQIESNITDCRYNYTKYINSVCKPFLTKTIFGNIFLNQKIDTSYFKSDDFIHFNEFISDIVMHNFDMFDLWNYEQSIHYEFDELDENYKISDFLCFDENIRQNIPYFSDEEYEILNSYAFGNINVKYCFIHYKNMFLFIQCSSK